MTVEKPTFRDELSNALSSAETLPQDGAAIRLAYGYADRLDQKADPQKYGPLFLAVLAQLGMTPAGRARVIGKEATDNGSGTPTSPLDELRQRRARKRNAANLDATTG